MSVEAELRPRLTVSLSLSPADVPALELTELETIAQATQSNANFPLHTLGRHGVRTAQGITWSAHETADTFELRASASLATSSAAGCGARLMEYTPDGSMSKPGAPRRAVSALHCLIFPLGLMQFASAIAGEKLPTITISMALDNIQGLLLGFDNVDFVLTPASPVWNYQFWNHDGNPCHESQVTVERKLKLPSDQQGLVITVSDLFAEIAYFFQFRIHCSSSAHPPERVQRFIGELQDWLNSGATDYGRS